MDRKYRLLANRELQSAHGTPTVPTEHPVCRALETERRPLISRERGFEKNFRPLGTATLPPNSTRIYGETIRRSRATIAANLDPQCLRGCVSFLLACSRRSLTQTWPDKNPLNFSRVIGPPGKPKFVCRFGRKKNRSIHYVTQKFREK